MTVKKLELDRATFDFIQNSLAQNGHEAAAGYMVKLSADLGRSFSTSKRSINLDSEILTAERIHSLLVSLNQSNE